jgi:HK97 family phage portal protein
VRWPWQREVEQRSTYSVSDPLLAQYFNVGVGNWAGVSVTEQSAMGLSAVFRAVSLISQTIASLPLRSLRDGTDGTRQRVPSIFDDPATPDGMTQFEWTETVLLYLLLHGAAPLLHIYNGGGGLAGTLPIHPLCVEPDWETDTEGKRTGRKVFTVSLDDGTRRTFTQDDLTYIPALSLDGLRGASVITMARNSLGTAIAGDKAAGRMFGNGAMIAGLVTPEEDVTEDEAKVIKEGLNAKLSGVENAGDIAVINRKLKFTPWTMSNEDAQFLQSRAFSIEEVARWFGVPPHLLMQTDKQTSWGSGVAEQNRGLARTVLAPWCNRIEQRLSRLLRGKAFVEFDLTGLERGNPEGEIELLIKQIEAGLLTKDEARAIRNLPPLPAGTPEPPTPEGAPA